ncbi:MAG: YidC/Oxa1 family membrane protein insertase, partial [Bacteroidales bacterium]|nr:YidC/Oxa1 family membrane protein insertase [Bacteroidales bacterium]
MEYLVSFFGWIMDWCHALVPNYWLDIVLFTAITKVLQFPLTLWCHVNSLKMVSLMPKTNRLKIQYYGDTDKIGEETAELFKREHYHPMLSLVPLALQIVILMGFVKVIYTIAAVEEGSLIGRIPVRDGGVAWVMPIIAAGAACVLGWCQNRINPLQREQTKVQQMVTNGVSIGISLFLGVYVAMGVGLYWAVSNVLSILTQLWCNVTVRPSSKINYDDLEKSKAEIASLENGVEVARSKSDRAREKRDYKRFFSVANKHLVFYAEGGGYYKYFKTVIEWLLQNSNVVIHYVTNDPQDGIFKIAENERRLRPYYIGQMRTITLFMKMDADIVVMTTPDLGTYQLKRSYVKRDVEYCYIGHGTSSISLTFRKGAFDHFDTVFVNGQYHIDEHRATERVYGLKPKTLVPAGYPYLDTLVRMNPGKSYGEETGKELILIAPSHQPGNLLESCLREMVESLCREGRVVVVRPHPQYIRRFPAKVRLIVESFKEQLGEGLRFELDFSVNTSVLSADLLITDWSAIAFEYAIVTKRPVVFVNTPPKITNPEWD